MARPEQHSHLPRGDEARTQTELDHRRFHRLPARAPSKPNSRHPHHAATETNRVIRRLADRAEFALLLNQFRDEAGPAGLMRRAEAGAAVAMKVFVKPITILIALVVECSG